MRKPTKFIQGILLAALLLAAVFPATVLAQEDIVEVTVSPNMLALNSAGGSVSLHADISYSLVEGTSLTVDGENLPVLYTFADDRGDLVVKCSIDTLKGMVDADDEELLFILTIVTADVEINASDTIGIASPNGK